CRAGRHDDRSPGVPAPRAGRRFLRGIGRARSRLLLRRGARRSGAAHPHGSHLGRRHADRHPPRARRAPPAMIVTLVRPSFYQDSVVLLALARELRSLPGVTEAAALMATPANRDLLAQSGLGTDEVLSAGPNDLVVAIRAERDDAERARTRAE